MPLAALTPRSPGAAACLLALSRPPPLLQLLCPRRQQSRRSWLRQPHPSPLRAHGDLERVEPVLPLIAAPLALASWREPLAAEFQD